MPPREWDEDGNPIGEAREWDEQGRPVTQSREEYLTRNYTPLGGSIASLSQGATFGISDEAEGVFEAIRRGGTAALTGGPDWLGRVRRAAGEGYRDAADTTRLFVERHRREAPILSAVNEIGGAITTGGAGAPRVLERTGARGLPLLARQIGRGGATAAAGGAVYGFGSTDGSLEDRLAGANQGAAVSAPFGAAAPVAVNVAGPVIDATVRAARHIPVPARSSVGAFGRPLARTRPAPQTLNPAAAGTIDRLADRAGLTADDVEAALAGARRNPQGQVLADVFDEPGRQTTRALSQWPGRTGQRASEIARQRGAEQPERILGSLRQGLRVSETRHEALQRLSREYRQASAETYQPLFRERLPADRAARLEEGLTAVRVSPTVRRAVRRAQELFSDEEAAGLVSGSLNDNPALFAHYVKLALDDVIQSGRRDGSLVGHGRRAAIELKNRIVALLDEALPEDGPGGGYAQARGRWGGLANAEEALDEGADFLNATPDSVRERIARMSDFERIHARIGLVDEITRGMRGGRVVGSRNVANALDYKDTQDIIAAAFDSPQQAADFLDVLNTSNQLMRNAATWTGGSSTAANAAYGADEALNVASDMAGSVAAGNPGAAVTRGARSVLNTVTLGAIERANNKRGAALLTRVDAPDAEEFGRQVVAELKRRAAIRSRRTAASDVTARAAGVAPNRRRD